MLNVGYKAKISHMADVSILLTILSKKIRSIFYVNKDDLYL